MPVDGDAADDLAGQHAFVKGRAHGDDAIENGLADIGHDPFAQPGDKVAFSDGFPLLLIGQASLDDLSARVGRPLEMLRFRPNLVIEGSAPYAEDGWKRIRIGDVVFRIEKPCERCVFTTVDPETGSKSLNQEPLRTLATYRRTPAGVIFGQNVIAEDKGELVPGMSISVLE